jgi:enoyl-CoA hydratase/carnithine racemase
MGQEIELAVSCLSQLSPNECKAVIITGAGRAFSAGGDVSFLEERKYDTQSNNTATMMAFYKRFLSIRTLPVPIIACINGPAIGAGLCFAMASDIRVTTHDAKLGYTFVSLGLHPGMGGTYYTAMATNNSQVASRLLLTGELITGAEAASLGLVNSSHTTTELAMTESLSIARKIANQSPMAIRSTIKTIRTSQDVGLHAALLNEATQQALSYTTNDYAEGLDALRDKRPPNFPGE